MKNVLLTASIALNLVLLGYLVFDNSSENKEMPDSNLEVVDDSINETMVMDEKGNTLDTVNIVMLGNSITYAGDWQEVLNREDVFNGGKPGWTTQQLSWVIKDFIIPNRPKLCFFKGGINDYTLGISTNRIYDNITVVLDSISKVGTKPVYTTTLYQRGATERNRQIDSLNQRMKAFCEEKGFDFMDLRPFLCEDGDILNQYVQDDNTHLELAAYPQWAKAMQPILKKYRLE